jgi:hypothetical protein
MMMMMVWYLWSLSSSLLLRSLFFPDSDILGLFWWKWLQYNYLFFGAAADDDDYYYYHYPGVNIKKKTFGINRVSLGKWSLHMMIMTILGSDDMGISEDLFTPYVEQMTCANIIIYIYIILRLD